jgi:hypothetical protein
MKRAVLPAAAAVLVAAGLALSLGQSGPESSARSALPDRLSDSDFWRISQASSEPGGTFHTENYVSNENRYQTVIPDLVARVKPGGVYLGVGPEQNFTYIAATKPQMVFIVDIRRGNLQEHLLYKALMELATDRADFISRLFSRPRPAGLGASSTVEQLFTAFNRVASSETLFRSNAAAILSLLTKQHALPLDADDRRSIESIYRIGFYEGGPNVMYTRNDGLNAGRRPTYSELMQFDDGTGRQRSYLASETSFAFLKNLQQRNLVVPVVGDFGGPKALRAVGAWVRSQGATISAFYLSNVETYLRRDGKWETFCASVATMPLTSASTFIRSQAGGGGFMSSLGGMQADTRRCSSR